MKNYLIAQRYARALSESIDANETLDGVLESLEDLAQDYRDHGELRTLLDNPAVNAETREQMLNEVIEAAQFTPVAADFVRVLFRRGRIGLLEETATAFHHEVDRRLRRVTARVTSATALTPEQEQRIQAGLETYTNKTVRLRTSVDPSILGGVVARLDGTVIDGSLQARLERLKQSLMA